MRSNYRGGIGAPMISIGIGGYSKIFTREDYACISKLVSARDKKYDLIRSKGKITAKDAAKILNCSLDRLKARLDQIGAKRIYFNKLRAIAIEDVERLKNAV